MTATGGAAGVLAGTVVVLVAVRLRPSVAARTVAGRDRALAGRERSRVRWPGVAFPATLGVVASVLLVGPAPTILSAGVAIGAVAARRRRASQAAASSIDAAMPDAIELLVIALHAGYSPTQAIEQLARGAPPAVRPAFAAVAQRIHRGQAFADALAELTARCGPSALALVNAMSAAVRDGLPLAPVLDRLSDEANHGRRRQGEAAARRLPVRLSFPLVVCTLPSFVLLAIAPAVLGALSTLQGQTP